MLVDEIFALYLYRMSNRINRSYYKTVLAYVIFFRECLNEYGWGKKIESEAIQLENNPDLKNDIANKQFCLVNNAEHAPEICNEFVTVYMEYKKSIIDIPKHDQIDLTINFCHWLFQCQFTCSKLTMIGWDSGLPPSGPSCWVMHQSTSKANNQFSIKLIKPRFEQDATAASSTRNEENETCSETAYACIYQTCVWPADVYSLLLLLIA